MQFIKNIKFDLKWCFTCRNITLIAFKSTQYSNLMHFEEIKYFGFVIDLKIIKIIIKETARYFFFCPRRSSA